MTDNVRLLDAQQADGKAGCYTWQCQACGVLTHVPMPYPARRFARIGLQFEAVHRDCKPSPFAAPAGGSVTP